MKPSERPSLSEQYEVAAVTSNLGLPHGEGTGAQGILAAAAWTEVHLGSDLRRLRIEWETKKPNAHWMRAKAQFVGGSREMRRRWAGKIVAAQAKEYLGALQELQGWRPAMEKLTLYAAQHSIEYPDAEAYAVLRRWLESPKSPPEDANRRLLWGYVLECLANASRALPQGMRGRTNHHPG